MIGYCSTYFCELSKARGYKAPLVNNRGQNVRLIVNKCWQPTEIVSSFLIANCNKVRLGSTGGVLGASDGPVVFNTD